MSQNWRTVPNITPQWKPNVRPTWDAMADVLERYEQHGGTYPAMRQGMRGPTLSATALRKSATAVFADSPTPMRNARILADSVRMLMRFFSNPNAGGRLVQTPIRDSLSRNDALWYQYNYPRMSEYQFERLVAIPIVREMLLSTSQRSLPRYMRGAPSPDARFQTTPFRYDIRDVMLGWLQPNILEPQPGFEPEFKPSLVAPLKSLRTAPSPIIEEDSSDEDEDI